VTVVNDLGQPLTSYNTSIPSAPSMQTLLLPEITGIDGGSGETDK